MQYWERRLHHPGRHAHQLIAVEVSRKGVRYGTPRGGALLVYNPGRHTLIKSGIASEVEAERYARQRLEAATALSPSAKSLPVYWWKW